MAPRLAAEQHTMEADRIGFFGKLPSHGDFVATGLNRTVQESLDTWLQAGLVRAQNRVGEQWEKMFHTMPAWRFVIERGIWGPVTIVGIIVPSRDRVGRSFPLVLAAQLHDYADDSRKLCLDDTWFIALESFAETTGQRDFEVETFTANLKRLRRLRPGDFEFADTQQDKARRPDTLWWRYDPEDRQTKGFRSNGAPQAADFLELMMAGMAQASQPAPEPQPIPVHVEPAHAPTLAAAPDVIEAIPTQVADEPEILIDMDFEEMMNAVDADLALILQRQAAPEPVPHPAPRNRPTSLASSHATHSGTRLAVNADQVLARDTPRLFAIADGLGDGNDAVEAARTTIAMLADTAPQETIENLVQEIKGKLGRAHGLLQSTPGSQGRMPPVASLVSLAAIDDRFALAWAGDARAYLVRDGMMRCLTRDHVTVGLRRSLSRGIGLPGQLSPEVLSDTLHPADRFLLCSQPLTRTLSERSIAEILISADLEDVAQTLIQESLIANCRENVSAIVIDAVDGRIDGQTDGNAG